MTKRVWLVAALLLCTPPLALAGSTEPELAIADVTASVNENVVPAPGSLSSQSRPSISSTRRRQMVRPRPVPPCLRVVDMSACVNGWNSFAA